MFGLFKTPRFLDSKLGELRRTKGLWRGAILMQGEPVPLALRGTRRGPDPRSLQLAQDASAAYQSWQPAIAREMFEYYSPYAEAVENGEAEPPEEGLPNIQSADDIWPFATIEFVQVMPLDGELTVEIGYRVDWDDEHTLGARWCNGQLIELNGSVLPP